MTDVQKLSERFSFIIRQWLTAEQVIEVNLRNAMNRDLGDNSTCATHDFCDANMAMHQAFLDVLDVDASAEDNINNAFVILQWSKAWDLSKANEFQPSGDLGKAIELLKRALPFIGVLHASNTIELIKEIEAFLSGDAPTVEEMTVPDQSKERTTFYDRSFGEQLRGYVDGIDHLSYSIETDPSGVWKFNLTLIDDGGIVMEYGYDYREQAEFDIELANRLFKGELTEL